MVELLFGTAELPCNLLKVLSVVILKEGCILKRTGEGGDTLLAVAS